MIHSLMVLSPSRAQEAMISSEGWWATPRTTSRRKEREVGRQGYEGHSLHDMYSQRERERQRETERETGMSSKLLNDLLCLQIPDVYEVIFGARNHPLQTDTREPRVGKTS